MATKAEALAKLRAWRNQIDAVIAQVSENPAVINAMPETIRVWAQGAYVVGDVRKYGGIPYKCVQAHDSTQNPDWTPDATPALWMQYHGTTPKTARAWVVPTGAHDMYLAGEYMVFTDGQTYKCLSDTNYSPTDYAQAWEAV